MNREYFLRQRNESKGMKMGRMGRMGLIGRMAVFGSLLTGNVGAGHRAALLLAFIFTARFSEPPVLAQSLPADLARVDSGSTKAVNALWHENPLAVQFRTTTNVVVADLKGPAEITMIHFAYPAHRDPVTGSLNRDVRLRIFWEGETTPSVDCPLVDFFCDPNGEHDSVNTALVNVRQGFNAYFPCPFVNPRGSSCYTTGRSGPARSWKTSCPATLMSVTIP